MARQAVLAAFLFLLAAGGTVTLFGQEPPFAGKGKKDKGDKLLKEQMKAEKWAMKLSAADPATAERWSAEKAAKEQAKAAKEQARAERDAGKPGRKGEPTPPPAAADPPAPRPTVQRYGSLPRELPKWWAEVDLDKDVQLSLFEWRTAGKPIDEFPALDLNNDGYLTVDEYLRATKPDDARRK